MAIPVSFAVSETARMVQDTSTSPQNDPSQMSDLGKRFEQMLWTEMLSHAGLEQALTRGGGEAASSFSRFVVEAIAKDLAERHPLGFADALPTNATSSEPGETQ